MNASPTRNAKTYWDQQALLNHAAAAIDPADRQGRKNAYIAHSRNIALASGLNKLPSNARVLDYGCGTGTFLKWMKGWRPDLSGFGADFSKEMLHIALELNPALDGRLTVSNSQDLPFHEGTFASICTAITLIYLLENSALFVLAREFRRTLAPGGMVISVEQVRRRTHHQTEHFKIQRSPEELIEIFAQAGFELLEWRQIRRGRFPLIYLIRYGLIPLSWHDCIARFEARLWRNFRAPQLDYADALFVWKVRK